VPFGQLLTKSIFGRCYGQHENHAFDELIIPLPQGLFNVKLALTVPIVGVELTQKKRRMST
jgi:hypothetical protein